MISITTTAGETFQRKKNEGEQRYLVMIIIKFEHLPGFFRCKFTITVLLPLIRKNFCLSLIDAKGRKRKEEMEK